MFFKTILLVSIFAFEALGLNNTFPSSEQKLADTGIPDQIEADGLYDPEILALYNSTENEEELFLTENYQTYYFNKLGDNIGDNSKGSCGFVATGMLLSFWDTYWDDNIVPEEYDATTALNEGFIDLYANSPGVIQEPDCIADASTEVYDQYIHDYADKYFHFKLIDLFENEFGNREPGQYGMGYNDYVNLFNYYVYDFLDYSSSDVEIIASTTDVRNKTIELVKEGIPVKLGIGNHAVVAYDYDENTDNIYCNFGWGPNSTHVTIEQMGYSQYTNLVAFNFKDDHHDHHSNNYTYVNEYGENDTLCSCWACIPKEVILTSGNYLDLLPTYKWVSLIHEKWHRNLSLHFTFSILDNNRHEVFKDSNVYDHEYTLTENQWDMALSVPGKIYYVYIGFESPVDPYWDDYYCLTQFAEPKDYANKVQIKPADWVFEERYWFANEGDNGNEYKEKSLKVKGLNITSQRLRCGYIEEQYINLSPRREGAGEAYLRLTWDKPVYSYMFGASYWSGSENLDGIAVARVMFKDGSWQDLEDPDFNLRAIGLSTTRSNIKRFVGKHSQGIYGLEFYATSSATGDRNKGRICLDDIVLNTDPYDLDFISTNYSSIG